MAKPKKKPPAPSTPRVQTIRAADVQPEELEFLWLDRIPRGVITLVGGRPKQGKSLFTYYLAAEVTKRGGAVLMSNPEDRLGVSKAPRTLAAGADPRLVHFWPGIKARIPEDVELLEELVGFHGIELVVLDPIAKHIARKDTVDALETLGAMAERTNVSVVCVHHIVKRMPRDAHPMDAFGGPYGGWVGSARAAHLFGPAASGDENARYLVEVAGNETPEGKPAVEFYIDNAEVDMPDGTVRETGRLVFMNDTTPVFGENIVNYKGGDPTGFKHQGGEKLAGAIEWLTLMLMHGPVPGKDLNEKVVEVGLSRATLKRASAELNIVKKRVGFGPGSYLTWELPPEHPILSMGQAATPQPEEDEMDAELRKLLDEAAEGDDA
jgi:hypothetical protein